MNKQQILERMAALEQQAEALKAEAGALRTELEKQPEVKKSLLHTPGGEYWKMGIGQAGPFAAQRPEYADDHSSNVFPSEEMALAYAEAIDTMLLLRHQPGTVGIEEGRQMYSIDPESGNPTIKQWWSLDCWSTRISPCFDSAESAQAAIDAIGDGRIRHMFRTFHHVGD